MMPVEPLGAIMDQLRQKDGLLWMRVEAETHPQYGETPFWVLVEDQDQIERALPFLQSVLGPVRHRFQTITIAFLSLTRTTQLNYGMLEGEEVFAPDALDRLYEKLIETARIAGVFDHAYPADPYAIIDEDRLLAFGGQDPSH